MKDPSVRTQNAGRVVTKNIVDHAEAAHPFDWRMSQMSCGDFRGVRDYVRVGDMLLYRQSLNRRMLVQGASPRGYFMFGTSSSPASCANWCGQTLSDCQFAFAAPSTPVDFTTPDDTTHVVLWIPESLMRRYFEVQPRAAKVARATHLAVDPRSGGRFLRASGRLIDRYLATPEVLGLPHERSSFQSRMMELLDQCLNPRDDQDVDSPTSSGWRVVVRALEYLHDAEPGATVSELADVAGVSIRTLEYAFKRQLGVTPLRSIRYERLNRAHWDLRSASLESGDTVTDIATRWGFTELGRFAVEYRRHFSERPSETLSRS